MKLSAREKKIAHIAFRLGKNRGYRFAMLMSINSVYGKFAKPFVRPMLPGDIGL